MSVESCYIDQYVSLEACRKEVDHLGTPYMPKTTIQMIVRRIVLMMRPRMWENPIHAR